MVAIAPIHSDLHSFKLAYPVVRPASRFGLSLILMLTMLAMSLWLVVIPAEFALRVTA